MVPRPADIDASAFVDRAAERSSIASTFRGLVRYRHLLLNLVLKDLKLKYRGSVFGFLWSLANPLLMIVVYTIAFTYILGIRREGFVFYLMLGILAWTFFANSLTMSTGAIADNGGLVKSVFFPRAILPASGVLFNLAQYLLTAVVFLPVMLLWYHVTPAAPMILFPVFVLLQVLFTIGLALVLATGTAFFRDVRHLVEVGLAVLFWTTPIVYELAQVPERLRLPILLSPLSSYVTAYHQIFYYRAWPDATTWTIAVSYACGALAVGLWLIVQYEDRFAERV
jgi:lipopolysaccharide transport system permease protein